VGHATLAKSVWSSIYRHLSRFANPGFRVQGSGFSFCESARPATNQRFLQTNIAPAHLRRGVFVVLMTTLIFTF